jgi:hypothetical protein
MVEKKVILCAILAITIGIGTIVPMEYLMSAQAQANAQTAQAQEKANAAADVQALVQPMFSDINITYAYSNLDKTSSNDSMTLYGSSIEAVVNFTLAPDALKNADAQIEYYKFAVSSDQGPIFNMGYYLVLEANSYVTTGMGGPEGTITFANGLTFNGPSATDSQDINFGSGGQCINYPAWDSNFTMGYVSNYICGTDPNNLPQAVTELRNAQTLYIDVSKLCTVTVNGNVTVTTPASNQILQHIVLTKTGDGLGFTYGSYSEAVLYQPAADLFGPNPNSGETGNNTTSAP